MGAVVTTDFQIGGKSNLSRSDLNKIIQVLGIADPQGKLPVGRKCRYVLVLEADFKVPTEIPVPGQQKKTKSKKKSK
jgi:hypothetical protein